MKENEGKKVKNSFQESCLLLFFQKKKSTIFQVNKKYFNFYLRIRHCLCFERHLNYYLGLKTSLKIERKEKGRKISQVNKKKKNYLGLIFFFFDNFAL